MIINALLTLIGICVLIVVLGIVGTFALLALWAIVCMAKELINTIIGG